MTTRRPSRRMTGGSARRAARLWALVTAAVLPLLIATPALAGLDDGEHPGKGIGIGEVVAIYILIPLGIFAVIALLSILPSMLRRPRYRPGRPWQHDPLWFNGPDDPEQALVGARPGATARGGASAEW